MTSQALPLSPALRTEVTEGAIRDTSGRRLAPPETSPVQRERRKTRLVEHIRTAIAEMVQGAEEALKIRNSDYLSQKLDYDYTYLANLFSEATGSTIEQHIIERKIERVKDLLLSDELNLTQISYKLHYSSVAHLSNQFKKVTGLTPTIFKQLSTRKRDVGACGNDVNFFCNCVKSPKIQRVNFALYK